jgi:hypothetical protein
MKLGIVCLAAVSIPAGVAYGLASDSRRSEVRDVGMVSTDRFVVERGDRPTSGSPLERLERSIKLKPGSKKALGGFTLASGRRVQLYTADTEDAKSCLVEDDPEAGAGAGCLEGGLFRERQVAFSVDTQGGPDRFDELYVTGVVASNIRSAELTKSDGTAVRIDLAESRAFVYESPSADLESRVYPDGFRLFGPNGKLVETVSFPAAGS